MSSGVPLNSSRMTATFSAVELDDPNGVKLSFATTTGVQSLAAADYDGALVADSGTRWGKLARTITISRSAAAASYTTTDITLTGKRGGATVTEALTPADANGGDILRGTQAWDAPPAISIPAQVDGAGLFEIGVGDICVPATSSARFHAVTLHADGQLNVQYGEAIGSPTDSFPARDGAQQTVAPTRILTDPTLTTPTTVQLTVALP